MQWAKKVAQRYGVTLTDHLLAWLPSPWPTTRDSWPWHEECDISAIGNLFLVFPSQQ